MAVAIGEFEQLILFALLRLDARAYGVTVRREIERRTGRSLSAGAIYTALGRLEARGLVSSRLRAGDTSRSGQRRKYYRITRPGAEALERSYSTVRKMAAGQGVALQRALGRPAKARG